MNPSAKRQDFEQQIDGRIARFSDRQEDWETLGFQSQVDPRFRRAQIRYIGSGATGEHADDPTIVPSEHFTLSTMLLPPGGEGPLHVHNDAEEVFFVLDGELTVIAEQDGQTLERKLGPRDLISVPTGLYRGVRNDTKLDVRMLVIIGSPKPERPDYPQDSPVRRPE
jgi:mannose-6-phosphate isomerase-like protein (cupin superfamily)